jgi:hypothetical protein
MTRSNQDGSRAAISVREAPLETARLVLARPQPAAAKDIK